MKQLQAFKFRFRPDVDILHDLDVKRNATTIPAIYVGTYYKYNGGSIFGKWFDMTEFDCRDDFY